jgi:hypothetical protein
MVESRVRTLRSLEVEGSLAHVSRRGPTRALTWSSASSSLASAAAFSSYMTSTRRKRLRKA